MDRHLALALDQAVRDSLDLYESLQLGLQASSVEVKHAYKTLARKLHPDKLGAAADPTPFHQLVQAYEVLSNPVSRDLYDAAACVWLTAERYVNEYRDLSLTVSGLGLRNSSLPPQQQDPPHTTAQGLLTAA